MILPLQKIRPWFPWSSVNPFDIFCSAHLKKLPVIGILCQFHHFDKAAFLFIKITSGRLSGADTDTNLRYAVGKIQCFLFPEMKQVIPLPQVLRQSAS